MIIEAINKLTNRLDLDYDMAVDVMEEITSGKATDSQIASFLTAMSMKGETIDEITAFATVMRKNATKLVRDNSDVIDIVGTGGDNSHSINISTITSIIVAAAGIPVAKHGNRAASSKCGTADCLEELGVNLSIEPEHSSELLSNIGICFLFAQKYHSSMKYVAGVRKEIKIPTVFNIMGPLANPASANLQLLGVSNEKLLVPLAKVLSNLGVKRGMVVYGQDKLDEISLSALTSVCEFENGEFKEYVIDPRDYGMELCTKEDLLGGSPKENAQFALEILNGKKGPKTDAVLLNAAAAIHIAKNVSIKEGIDIARKVIEEKKAIKQLEAFVSGSNRK